jgi:integrase
MTVQSPQRERLEGEKRRLREAVEKGDVSEQDSDAILELCNAYDEQKFNSPVPTDSTGQKEKHREPTTLALWCQRLRLAASDIELTDADVDGLNEYTEFLLKEKDHRYNSGKGLSRNSVRAYQDSFRRFYRYHDDLGVDPTEIATISRDDSKVDPTDMLTPDEIQAAREAADNPRDLATLDLLLYTGQRNMAIRSLRIRDIDLENGRYRLNDEMDGLKRADENGEWRPLLLAKASVQEWLKYHPYADDPDAYLLAPRPKYNEVDPTQMLARNAVSRVTNKIKERAQIDKPMHPHALRHNFVTLMKREYGLDDATIKYLIGHSQSSNVMETTYQHLDDEDHIQAAEEALGLRDPEEDSSLTPPVCPQCGEPLPGDAKACHCGLVITPDAQAVKRQVRDDQWEDKAEAEGDEEDALDKFKQLLDENPELIEELTERT